MSTQITTAFVEQYKNNVQLLSQQKGSRLRDCVRMEYVTGTNAFFEQIGAVTAVKGTSRHGDTPQIDTPHARRRVTLADFRWADLIDDDDKVKMLIDPTSSYAASAAAAMGRAMDDEIIAASIGSADTGVAGGTAVALPASQQIAVGAVGLTIEKLIQAKEILWAADIDEELPLYIAVTGQQLGDLLRTTEVTSSDYNTVKALVQGSISSFMGFNFKRSERIDNTTTTRHCFAWAQDGICLGVGRDVIGRISERDDKNYSTQVFYAMNIGATRMEEAKVVQIDCLES
ncbi:MAG: hypothetical protein DRP45_00935 [Candidatus Zixiibacteriota bacterium]|nr:MAG: hypothetical protein DRP45_00935 [candidate division Zixibacteria bacterium]